MKTLHDRDALIAEALRAPELDLYELQDLVARMRECLDEGVILSISETAQLLGVSTKTVWYYYTYDGLPSMTLSYQGRYRRLFYEHDVHEWLRSMKYKVLQKRKR